MGNSSYLQYLPPVLWSPASDPSQMLGRHLRIYEKLLTGIRAGGRVISAAAPFASAHLSAIQLNDEADAARFAVGDWIAIEGTAERRRIEELSGPVLLLDANLAGPYPGGVVRIADLVPGQTTFRADNAAALEPGYPLKILQAGQTEPLLVEAVNGAMVTLRFGLAGTYRLDAAAVPVKLLDGLTSQTNGRTIPDLETQIDALFKTFNPWRARTEFLDWLASWLALPLPPEPTWSDYQRRKMISQIAGIYQKRGLKQGI